MAARKRSKRGSGKKARPSPWQGSLRLGAVFVALIGINVYFLFLRGGTSLRALMKTTELAKQNPSVAAPAPRRASQKSETITDEGRLVEGALGDGDTLERAWKGAGLSPTLINGLAKALGKKLDLRSVRAGQRWTLRFDSEDHLRDLEYRINPLLAYLVTADGSGWKVEKQEQTLEVKQAEIGGVVRSSLWDALRRTGESTALVGWFVDTLAWDMNFYTDCNVGDQFKLIVEKEYLGGKFYKYGRVLAAEYRGRTGTFRAFWFAPKDGTPGSYYTEHGENIVKSLLKTPLKYVRVSSAFDRHRFHPILHRERAHLGVDYAAPTGTPVWATAAGQVTFVGPRGGAGNAVIVDHGNGMTSTYMHLSRFARGLAVGQRVRQKQVIGYVGMTGLATGPHLHFSVRVNGAFVDPLKLKPAREAPITPRYRQEFADVVAPRLQLLAAIRTTPATDRLVSRGLSPLP